MRNEAPEPLHLYRSVFVARPGVLKTIESESVFTKAEMNN